MTKKLLQKTQNNYFVYALLVFIVISPLFYFISKKMYINEADETLIQRKTDFIKNTSNTLTLADIELWNKYNSIIKIEPPTRLKKDSLFDNYAIDKSTNENEQYRILKSPITIDNQSYTFVSKINLVENEDLIQSIVLLFFILIILLLGGMLYLTKKLSSKLWNPFYKTLENIEQFEIDKTENLTFLHSDIEEFERLNSSIQNLVDKNRRIFNSQKEFVENAAHELQTPLAVFRAKIETLIQSKNLTQEQAEILNSLNNSVAQLHRLNKNLLLLSKIDSDQFTETKEFSLQQEIENIVDFFKEQALLKNISITTSFKESCVLNTNKVLTEIVISNLLMNAVRHNIENGKIEIELTNQYVSIKNTGVQESLNTGFLFNRFSKINSTSKGNGLGLAIVKKICFQNNWKIGYSYQNNLHVFTLTF